ncbi:Crp/Fnr family transcriptional regulator [Treponema sp.]|uniref:Crp/Fnr family transcriptional regulator n=1 Tax=Treponema sp. TaxID=166 RepID=UPI00388DC776
MLQLSFVNFRKDNYILVEGKEDFELFYIIQSGHVKLSSATSKSQPTVLGPGDFIGVIACMSQHPQMETCVAMSDVVCIVVRRDQYIELIEKNTPVAMKIIRTFAQRMRLLNETLMQQTLSNAPSENFVQMFNVAEYFDGQQQFDIAFFAYYQYLKVQKDGPLAQKALKRIAVLQKRTHAVYIEPSQDMLRSYPANTMIFSESQSGADMFVIQSGSVKISKIVDGTEVTLAVLKKGDMFGEMALLENKPRSASAIAKEDCMLMTINKSNFEQMVSSQPQLIARLTNTLAERLWSMHRQLANTLLSGNHLAKMTDMLALQVEKNRIVISKNTQYQTNLTVEDLATMCGFTKDEQARAIYDFTHSPLIKLEKGKIFIPDCLELLKQAAFYRKQVAKANGTL